MKGRVTLMHKDEKVASCYFSKDGHLTQVYSIFNESLLPVVAQKDTLVNLQKWVSGRFTAKNRKDLADYRDFYKFDVRTLASAMDGYWIRENKSETWEEVSPFFTFRNESDEVERIVFFPDKVKDEIFTWDSPNLTIPLETESFLLKEGPRFYLLQGAPGKKMAQYKTGCKNNIPLAKREYMFYKNNLFAKVELDINEELEYIPFEEYYLLYEKDKNKSHFENVLDCCEHFGIPNYKEFLDDIVRFSEMTGVSDWKLSDIGVLRDSKTLKIKKFHPLI